jgi:hypothetical protein
MTSIAERWFERVLEGYPAQTAQFVREQGDRFRNPVGYTLQQGLEILAKEVLGGMDRARIGEALDGIVRLRAVQDLTPAEAVGFVFLLRDVMAAEPEYAAPQFHKNVDTVALMAFNLYMNCRDQVATIRGREAWRCPSGVTRDGCGG